MFLEKLKNEHDIIVCWYGFKSSQMHMFTLLRDLFLQVLACWNIFVFRKYTRDETFCSGNSFLS